MQGLRPAAGMAAVRAIVWTSKGSDLVLSRIQPRMLQAAQWTLVAAFLFFPVAFALGNAAIVLAFVLSIGAGAYRERWQAIRDMPVVWWALGLYAVILAGVLYSPAPAADVRMHLFKYGKLLLVPALLPLLVEPLWRGRCMNAFLAAMGFILASVYGNVFWQLPWSATHNQGWGLDHTVVGDYITQNVMMSFFVIVAIARGRAAAVAWRRWGWWACALAAAVAVTQLSKGRTGYVLLVMAVVTYVSVALKGRLRWAVLGGLVLAMALALLTSHTVRARIELGLSEAAASDSMAITSIGGRVNFWSKTLQLALEKPVLGWGTGSYHSVWCQHITKEGWCWFGGWHPHNQYLFFWMENGLAGLVLFALLVSASAWAARRAAVPDRPLLWGFAAIFAVDSLINAPLFSGRESHFFVMLLIWVCAQARFAQAR
jgi:O-antigen ligase